MNISEFELISRIKSHLTAAPVGMIRGIGEDCAVLKKDESNAWLVSTDCLVESVHFDFKYFSFVELGKKAMSVNLSDIAAMGGEPRYALVTLGIPKHVSEIDIGEFYTGLDQVAGEFGAAIVGGDTSFSPKLFFVNVVVIGVVKNEAYKLRSAAKPGDGIYVSGNLGSSAVGLGLLRKRKAQENVYVQAHKNPRPKVALGRLLGECPDVHAMIDLSDGLIQDLSHVMEASGTAAEIDFESVPREEDFETVCRTLRLDPDELLLAGGEDYQLLFTMPDVAFPALEKILAEKRLKVTRIGRVHDAIATGPDARSRVKIWKSGRELVLKKTGFDHFTAGK
jgi:thiamine-monophosphate kinase